MVNVIHLIGNVGKDAETKMLSSNSKVATFSLATSSSYNNKDGERITETEWHNIKCWGKLAELAEKYIKKGTMLFVEGKVTYRSYDDKDGNKRYVTEVVANSIQLLGGRKQDDVATRPEGADPQDDLPF